MQKKEGIKNDPAYIAAFNAFESKMLVEMWMKKNFSRPKSYRKRD